MTDWTHDLLVGPSPYMFRRDDAVPQRFDALIVDEGQDLLNIDSLGKMDALLAGGLESEVVFLIDMPTPGSDTDLPNLHYIGMSRARALLYLLTDDGNHGKR